MTITVTFDHSDIVATNSLEFEALFHVIRSYAKMVYRQTPADEISRNVKAARDRGFERAVEESGLMDKILEAEKKYQESKKVDTPKEIKPDTSTDEKSENPQVNKTDTETGENPETAIESKTDTPTNEKSVDREAIESEIKSMSGARSGTGLSKKIKWLIRGYNVNMLSDVPIDKLKEMLGIVKVWATEIDEILQSYGVDSISKLSDDEKKKEIQVKVAAL